MLQFRSSQIAALAQIGDAGAEERAIRHLQECIPEACAALTSGQLREIVSWGRKRSRSYGMERELDYFRYLNLMFMFGFGFDSDPQYPWAGTALRSKGSPTARMDLVMDHAMVHCSKREQAK